MKAYPGWALLFSLFIENPSMGKIGFLLDHRKSIDGTSLGHRKPVDGISLGHRNSIDGFSMGRKNHHNRSQKLQK